MFGCCWVFISCNFKCILRCVGPQFIATLNLNDCKSLGPYYVPMNNIWLLEYLYPRGNLWCKSIVLLDGQTC